MSPPFLEYLICFAGLALSDVEAIAKARIQVRLISQPKRLLG